MGGVYTVITTLEIVSYVLRYTLFYKMIKEIIDSGEIGKVININNTENVAYWHHAHSYTRGNWKDSKETGPMILTKCSHDLDLLFWLTGKNVKRISSEAFVNCDQLIKIVIPDSVDIIDTTFLGCDSLTDIEVDENNKNYKSIEGNLYTKDGKALIRYALGKMDASYIVPQGVEIIRSDAFNYCKNLTMVTIPNSVHTIEIGLVIGGPFYEANIGLTIYGGSGSTAEKFAKKNRINFKEI